MRRYDSVVDSYNAMMEDPEGKFVLYDDVGEMAKATDLQTKSGTEQIVKITCMDFTCKNNMHRLNMPHCNLKYLVVEEGGKCGSYEKEL